MPQFGCSYGTKSDDDGIEFYTEDEALQHSDDEESCSSGSSTSSSTSENGSDESEDEEVQSSSLDTLVQDYDEEEDEDYTPEEKKSKGSTKTYNKEEIEVDVDEASFIRNQARTLFSTEPENIARRSRADKWKRSSDTSSEKCLRELKSPVNKTVYLDSPGTSYSKSSFLGFFGNKPNGSAHIPTRQKSSTDPTTISAVDRPDSFANRDRSRSAGREFTTKSSTAKSRPDRTFYGQNNPTQETRTISGFPYSSVFKLLFGFGLVLVLVAITVHYRFPGAENGLYVNGVESNPTDYDVITSEDQSTTTDKQMETQPNISTDQDQSNTNSFEFPEDQEVPQEEEEEEDEDEDVAHETHSTVYEKDTTPSTVPDTSSEEDSNPVEEHTASHEAHTTAYEEDAPRSTVPDTSSEEDSSPIEEHTASHEAHTTAYEEDAPRSTIPDTSSEADSSPVEEHVIHDEENLIPQEEIETENNMVTEEEEVGHHRTDPNEEKITQILEKFDAVLHNENSALILRMVLEKWLHGSDEPSTLLVVGRNSGKFIQDLTASLSSESENQLILITSKTRRAELYDNVKRVLSSSEEHNAVSLLGIENLSWDSPLVLHALVDGASSPFPKALILMSVEKRVDGDCGKGIERILMNRWKASGGNDDNVAPILSRIMNFYFCI